MDVRERISDRGRLVRASAAAVLSVAALGSLRKGKRLTGVLVGAGAVALGYDAATGTRDLPTVSESDTADTTDTDERSGELRCGICGEPIRPGQRRGPDEDGETVHEACEAPEQR